MRSAQVEWLTAAYWLSSALLSSRLTTVLVLSVDRVVVLRLQSTAIIIFTARRYAASAETLVQLFLHSTV